MENGSQKSSISSWCGEPFGSLFAIFSEDRFFDAFWPPLGSLLAPFWFPLAHFWLPLAHFWLPLAHFWLPLAPFWLTFGVPWLTFGALSFTFAHPGINFLTFAVSCRHFPYFFEFSMKISCQIWFLHNFFCLFQAALASRLVGLTEACRPKKAEGEGKF